MEKELLKYPKYISYLQIKCTNCGFEMKIDISELIEKQVKEAIELRNKEKK